MSPRSLVPVAAVAAVVAVASLVAGGSPAAPQFKVTSTLDGKKVLPHRLHWVAATTLSPNRLVQVDFLIDGKVRWIEHGSPYVYGDNEGRHRGYLVTSWLRPGEHTFAARAVAKNGGRATDTVVARVLPSPVVPQALAGTWQRKIDTSAAPKPGSASNPTGTLTPSGTYRIGFGRRWIHDTFPCDTSPCRFNPKTGAGGEFVSDWTPGASTFAVRGPVTFRVAHDTDRLAGWWCWMDGPNAKYAWSVSGNTLTIAPVGGHDACRIRGFIWAGTWTREG